MRIVIFTFELVSAHVAHLVFGGTTKPFQSNFVALRIKGQTYKDKESDVGQYFRVLKNVNLQDVQKVSQHLKDIPGSKCLCSSPVVIRMRDRVFNNYLACSASANAQMCQCSD